MRTKVIVEMESEVRTLRQDLTKSQESLRLAQRKCRELLRELNQRTNDYEKERFIRDEQLSRILRALLILESRLKQEQKSIRKILIDKDNLINSQKIEIESLRRFKNNYVNHKRCNCVDYVDIDVKDQDDEVVVIETNDFQEHDSGLGKDIQNLKCEIITKLNESLEEQNQTNSSNIKKTHSFAGSDISKVSLTSSENTDASIITTTTDGSPSLLSTEGFCEGESTDVSPGSTLNKSSNRCTPTIVTTDSETEVTMVILDDRSKIVRSESKDDGMDCNYVSDEDEGVVVPLYENFDNNNAKNLKSVQLHDDVGNGKEDCSNNNIEVRITSIDSDEQTHDESSGNWYSDPDEDRINDELIRHSVYRSNSKHNSVLECVNQILLRDMEDEENVLSIPRRFKHRGKIVRFQPARLSDIESVGSEMERRNSDDAQQTVSAPPPTTITTTVEVTDTNLQQDDENDNDTEQSIGSFEATNSEDEFGMRIIPPALNAESGIEEDVDESKARPIVILEPVVKVEEAINKSNNTRSIVKNKLNKPGSPTSMDRFDDNTSIKSLALSNHDYEEIESLPDIIAPTSLPAKPAPMLPPKPQFRNNTLILKKIPSPSFLIDETSAKKQQTNERLNSVVLNPVRSLKFDDNLPLTCTTAKKQTDNSDSWKASRFNNVRSSMQLYRPSEVVAPKVTSIVKHFEEFKIDNNDGKKPSTVGPLIQVLDDYDIQQNFEEFKFDDCDLSKEPERSNADDNSSDTYSTGSIINNATSAVESLENNNSMLNNTSNGNNGNYDSFLEATGLSNKSILTPSRMLSNHKSMLKPKDVKYKNKIKATAIMERHGPTTLTRHWTGPFV